MGTSHEMSLPRQNLQTQVSLAGGTSGAGINTGGILAQLKLQGDGGKNYLPEESSFFTSVGHPFPAVCIRTSTERPEALDKACIVLAGIDEKSLLQAVDTAVQMNADGDYDIPVPDYIEENVSTKVVKIIQSYTGVVNKIVWRK